MIRYWMRLVPEQPLAVRDEQVIPAQAVRGAIATVLLGTCKPGHEHDTGPCGADCRYWSLFGENTQLVIGPAYAANADEVQPFLATARTCSRVPGFKTSGGHGVFDVAIRQWSFEEASAKPESMMAPFQAHCPVCDAALMACEGLYTRQGEREFSLVGEVASTVTTNFVTMDRVQKRVIARHSAEAFVMNRGVYFVARVEVPERLDGVFKQTVAGGLLIGGQRSCGMGAVRVELIPYTGVRSTLADRIARFNRAVRAEQRYYAAMDVSQSTGDDGQWYFTVDLREAAFAAYEQAPSIVPGLSTLPGVIPVRRWLSPQVMGGWHSAAGLPRRSQIGAVGVVLYRVPAETNRIMVEELLAFIEAEGIGTARERGAGAVTICDPFHLYMDLL